MYYLYKKSKDAELPRMNYIFKNFKEFYEVASLLEVPLIGSYHISVKADKYQDIIDFLNVADKYPTLNVYIETSKELINSVRLRRPDVSLLESKSNFEVFRELITKYGVLFDKDCMYILYNAIDHSYSEMDEALELLKRTFGGKTITKDDITKLFVVEDIIYPRSIVIAYLMLYRGRGYRLDKCIDYFGNDMVLYSMRKTARKFLTEKIVYYKTGQGTKLISRIPYKNIIKMLIALDYNRGSFMDIKTIMYLYERGGNISDYLQKRTISIANEKHNAAG